MKRLKENNRGLSLIEVLVAVIILAIVVTPFLHSFVTTANTNRKAKEIHRATVLAQSVVESCKAETLESIAQQFDYPTDTDFRIMNKDRILDAVDWKNSVAEIRYNTSRGEYDPALNFEDLTEYDPADRRDHVTSSIYSEDDGLTGEFIGQEDGIYYFSIENVKKEVTDTRPAYDVLIKLDATTYETGSTEHDIAYNDTNLVQLPVINQKKDALCVQRDEYTLNAISEFYAQFQAVLYPEIINRPENAAWKADPTTYALEIEMAIKKEIAANLKREINLKITSTNVTAEYKYSYTHGTDTREYINTQTPFDSLLTGENLRNVYLYYYPLYGRTAFDDVINIDNETSVPIDLYLFKQKKDAANLAGSMTTTMNESTYKMSLYFKESAAGIDVDNMSTKLHTNLGINIAASAGDSEYEIATPPQAYLNGVAKQLSEVAVDKILSADSQDRVFDMEVSIYKNGAGASEYPESMHVATISGTKLK